MLTRNVRSVSSAVREYLDLSQGWPRTRVLGIISSISSSSISNNTPKYCWCCCRIGYSTRKSENNGKNGMCTNCYTLAHHVKQSGGGYATSIPMFVNLNARGECGAGSKLVRHHARARSMSAPSVLRSHGSVRPLACVGAGYRWR